MGDYASKGLAGTALGLAIPGTIALANQLFGGNGLLGGWGNRAGITAAAVGQQDYVSHLQAENAALKAENYADRTSKEVYSQTLADNKALRDELYAYIAPLAKEAADNRVNIARLEEQQKCCCEKQELREQILIGKITETALAANNKFNELNNAIQCLSGAVATNTARLNNITTEVIPKSAICPEVMERYNSWVAPTTTTPAAS